MPIPQAREVTRENFYKYLEGIVSGVRIPDPEQIIKQKILTLTTNLGDIITILDAIPDAGNRKEVVRHFFNSNAWALNRYPFKSLFDLLKHYIPENERAELVTQLFIGKGFRSIDGVTKELRIIQSLVTRAFKYGKLGELLAIIPASEHSKLLLKSPERRANDENEVKTTILEQILDNDNDGSNSLLVNLPVNAFTDPINESNTECILERAAGNFNRLTKILNLIPNDKLVDALHTYDRIGDRDIFSEIINQSSRDIRLFELVASKLSDKQLHQLLSLGNRYTNYNNIDKIDTLAEKYPQLYISMIEGILPYIDSNSNAIQPEKFIKVIIRVATNQNDAELIDRLYHIIDKLTPNQFSSVSKAALDDLFKRVIDYEYQRKQSQPTHSSFFSSDSAYQAFKAVQEMTEVMYGNNKSSCAFSDKVLQTMQQGQLGQAITQWERQWGTKITDLQSKTGLDAQP